MAFASQQAFGMDGAWTLCGCLRSADCSTLRGGRRGCLSKRRKICFGTRVFRWSIRAAQWKSALERCSKRPLRKAVAN